MKVIKEIHKSDLYCYISEIGAGVGLTNLLMSVEGASKTIYKSESNYSKRSQEVYNHVGRSVSMEFVETQLDYMEANSSTKVNTLVANSFQIGDDICSHGWVGIQTAYNTRWYFHFTLPTMDRKHMIEYIAWEQLSILHYLSDISKIENLAFSSLDGFIQNGESDSTIFTFKGGDSLICFDKEGKWQRFETLHRDKPLNIYLGSFNPLHEGHKWIADQSENTALVLTTDNYEKPSIDSEEINKRLEGMKGYNVIVTKPPLISDNINLIADRHNGPLTVSMGYDTYERCNKSLFSYNPNVTFKVFDRGNKLTSIASRDNVILNYDNPHQDISSTKIRNNEK